jgi:hypothetical protein
MYVIRRHSFFKMRVTFASIVGKIELSRVLLRKNMQRGDIFWNDL